MGKATMSLMTKVMDPVIINGKMSSFARVPYSIEVRLSQPLAEDGYGTAYVDGKEIGRGQEFFNDMIIKIYGLMLPVGQAARDFGQEHTLKLTGFKAADGTPFPEKTFKFKTAPHRERDKRYTLHDKAALQAAREGMVLLKNDHHVLPLRKDEILNLFGSAINMYRTSAVGAGAINPRWQPNLFEAIKDHSQFQVNEDLLPLYENLQDPSPSQSDLIRAKGKNNLGIIFISRVSGEFKDNIADQGGYYLTADEKQMIRTVAASFDRTLAVINTGYPIEMGWVEEFQVDAVLYTGYAGMLSAYALVEILDGRTNPSGKLPDTWAYDYFDYPSALNFPNFKKEESLPGDRDYGVQLYYEEDIYVGYRYFDTFGKKAAFCFGHGLSYTDFTIETIRISEEDGRIHAKVRVKNTGDRAGKEVVQLYVKAPAGRIDKAERVLCAFEKTILLKTGKEQILELSCDPMTYASFDEKQTAYVLEPGKYAIYIGNSLNSSKDVFHFTVDEEKILKKVHPVGLPVEEFHRISREDPVVRGISKKVPLEERISIPAPRPEYHPQELPAYRGQRITFRDLQKDPSLLNQFVAQMSSHELCQLNVCGGANWYMPWQKGEAGKTVRMAKYKLPVMFVSDGNTGVNIKTPNIGFPSSATICATFNKRLAEKVGQVIGEETKENGISMNLGPAMNIHRNILNGRHPEYFSEDPYLAGTMAGYHGKGLEEAGVGCCYKHLFCNGSDTCRKASQSIVSERALREIYYRVYEFAFAIQKPSALMTSYNSVNGIYPAENADMLQTLIRDEWHFDGFIMTDWGTYDTVDPVEMVKAGNCWLTEGGRKYTKALQKAVLDGKLERSVLEQNVRWLIAVMLKLTK